MEEKPDDVVPVKEETNTGLPINERVNSVAEPATEIKISPKSPVVAGLLALFLGSFGVHSFYLRQYTRGAIHLCIALLPWVVLGVVGLIAVLSPEAYKTTNNVMSLNAWVFGVIFVYGALVVNSLWAVVEAIIIFVGGKKRLLMQGLQVRDDDGSILMPIKEGEINEEKTNTR